MQAPPVDPTGDKCENVGLNTKPNPPQKTGPTEVVNEQYHSESVRSCLSTMTPCSPAAGCWERGNGYVIGGSPPKTLANPFSYEQVSEQPTLPSSSSLPMQMRNRYPHHRQQPSHPHYYPHQMGAIARGAVGGHGPDTPAPSSVSSIDDQVIYESDSQDDVDDSENYDNDDNDDDDTDTEEEDDDVFANDSVSKSFRDDSIPGYPPRVSQPIPIRNPGRMNRYNNNVINNNNDNFNLSNDSLTFEVQPCSSYPFDDRSRNWQHLYQLRTGSEMSPELDHVGNVYIPCSWAPELRRTIGTQTHPNFRSNTLFNLAACRLRSQQHSVANAGTNQRRLRFSEGEDPMAPDRQEPLPDIVPIPRNRAQSLPEVPIRRTNIRAFGQELRRISDEYYQSHNTRSRPESNRQAFSFPGADRINRVLYRILSLGRPLNADEPNDQPPPPP